MGWKISLITIENKDEFHNDALLLQKAGFRDHELVDRVDFETAINTKDKICIGEVNGNIVICDDYKLTEFFLSEDTKLERTESEKNISTLFPNSEILSVACHSVTDFHAYSLIQNGIKTRLKMVSQDGKIEYGNAFEQEQALYKNAVNIDGELHWDLDDSKNPEDFYTESQLMEEFTFGVIKRHLGVALNHEEAAAILRTKNFRVYNVGSSTESIKKENAKVKTWQRYLIYILIFLIYQLIRHYMK